jgi:hypothetical protein
MDHLLGLGVVSAEAVADLATFFGGGEVRASPKMSAMSVDHHSWNETKNVCDEGLLSQLE